MINGFNEKSAIVVSGICSKDGVLPQGAPTSPTISNSILIDFDESMDRHCADQNLTYSRYADDISISGDDRDEIIRIISVAEGLLRDRYKLSLNTAKTRIASQGGQQRVTGVVVNTGVRPPRLLRRNIRAAFHNAFKTGVVSKNTGARLHGYISYLMAYPDIQASEEIGRYRQILKGVRIEDAEQA